MATSPVVSLRPWQQAIAMDALRIAEHHLTAHGTEVGHVQRQSLLALFRIYGEMAFGVLESRVGVPLPTGWGKSTSAAAWCVALHRNRAVLPSSWPIPTVAIAASRVESLCSVKRDIIEMAERENCVEGLADQLGLLHSYRFDPAIAEDHLQRFKPLPDGYATEPADSDITGKQFALITHAKVQQGLAGLEAFSFGGRQRSLIIWDEALLPGDVISVSLDKVISAAAYLAEHRRFNIGVTEVATWVAEVKERFNAVVDHPEGGVVDVPAVDDDKRRRMIGQLPPEVSAPISTVLSMAGGSVRVHPRRSPEGSTGGIATYLVSVPDCLKRVVILDASFPVNRLYAVDHRVTPWDQLEIFRQLGEELRLDNLKDYSTVRVRHMAKGGGYSSIQNDARADGKLIADVVDVVKSIPASESVLIFTFLQRSSRDVNLQDRISRKLIEAGIDVDERIQFNGAERKRINILTWGSETSSNDFSHCHHVVLPGVLRLPFGAVLGQYLAATDSLATGFPSNTEREVVLGQLAHLVYQAASRGRSRSTDRSGTAGEMTLWLVDKDLGIRDELAKVMPGATWEPWSGRYAGADNTRHTKTDKAFARLIEVLSGVPQDCQRVTMKALWSAADPAGEFSADVRKAVAARFASVTSGWIRDPRGRGLIRADEVERVEAEERLRELGEAFGRAA